MLKIRTIKFKSQGKQLEIDEFKSSLQGLSKSNRWVKLGDSMPWAEIEILYNSKLGNKKRGAGNKPARMIIGALIIKHKMNLSDEETIYAIQENPYMQYFLGLSEFTDKPIFDSSLFVTIRKRLGTDDFNEMSLTLLLTQLEKAKSA
ncbi:MAG: transposase, partial [Phocaeicola sp.]